MNTLLWIMDWRWQSIREKSETSQDLVLFNEVLWNNVDMQLHFDAFNINQEEAESLLSVQNFSDNGAFLVRLDINEGQKNLMLSFVYEGRIHHHKIILMKYFNQYSYCLENGGINFPSVNTLIKYHASKMTLPIPCVLIERKEKRRVAALAMNTSKPAMVPLVLESPRLVRSRSFRVRSKGPEDASSSSRRPLQVENKGPEGATSSSGELKKTLPLPGIFIKGKETHGVAALLKLSTPAILPVLSSSGERKKSL